jgi:hypothetical protein
MRFRTRSACASNGAAGERVRAGVDRTICRSVLAGLHPVIYRDSSVTQMAGSSLAMTLCGQ